MSIVIELLSGTLGATRDQVRETLDSLESRLSARKADLSRRVGLALDNDDASQSADALVATAQTIQDDDTNRLIGKLLLSVAGAGWGVSIASAASAAGTTSVALGLGFTAGPAIAMILAVVIVAVSGYIGLKVLRELFRRMSAQVDQIQAF